MVACSKLQGADIQGNMCLCMQCETSWMRQGWQCNAKPRPKSAAKKCPLQVKWSVPDERPLQNDPYTVLHGMGAKPLWKGQRMVESYAVAMATEEARAMKRMASHQDLTRQRQLAHANEVQDSLYHAQVKRDAFRDRLNTDKEIVSGTPSIHRRKDDTRPVATSMQLKFCDNRFRTDSKSVGSWIANKKFRDRQRAAQDRAHMFAGTGRHAPKSSSSGAVAPSKAEAEDQDSDPENLACDGDDGPAPVQRAGVPAEIDLELELQFKPRKMKRNRPTPQRKVIMSQKRKAKKAERREAKLAEQSKGE